MNHINNTLKKDSLDKAMEIPLDTDPGFIKREPSEPVPTIEQKTIVAVLNARLAGECSASVKTCPMVISEELYGLDQKHWSSNDCPKFFPADYWGIKPEGPELDERGQYTCCCAGGCPCDRQEFEDIQATIFKYIQ